MKFLFLIFSFFTFSVLHATVYENISAMLDKTSCTFRVKMLPDGSGYGVYADVTGGTVYGSPFSQSTYADSAFYLIGSGRAGTFLGKTGSSASYMVGVAVPGRAFVVGVYSVDGYNYSWPSTLGAPFRSWDVIIADDGRNLSSADASEQAAAAAKKAADDANAAATAAATASANAKTSASSSNAAASSSANAAASSSGTAAGSSATSASSTAGSISSNSSDFAGLIASLGQVGQILVKSMEAANANSQGERALLKGAMDTMATTATQQGAQMQAGIDSMRAGIAAQGATGLAQIQAANEITAAVKGLGSGSGSGTDVTGLESRLDTLSGKFSPSGGYSAPQGLSDITPPDVAPPKFTQELSPENKITGFFSFLDSVNAPTITIPTGVDYTIDLPFPVLNKTIRIDNSHLAPAISLVRDFEKFCIAIVFFFVTLKRIKGFSADAT